MAFAFQLSRRPENISIRTLRKPKPLPRQLDDLGQPLQWSISYDKWDQLFAESLQKAQDNIEASKTVNSDVWAHAKDHQLEERSSSLAVRYAQWSIAAERAQIEANPTDGAAYQCMGRGLVPKFVWHSLEQKSIRRVVEHMLWSLPQSFAIAGCDLFSTLWGALAGIFRRLAASRHQDRLRQENCRTQRCIELYFPFSCTWPVVKIVQLNRP